MNRRSYLSVDTKMYFRLGEGNGLIALISKDQPERVIKIPKRGGWTLSVAKNKVSLLEKVGDSGNGVARTWLKQDVNLVWKMDKTVSRFSGKAQKYQGWAFEQERVYNILGKCPAIEKLDLAAMVAVHHGLWSSGVAFASPNELYGFFNKGFDKSGRLLSFDIGSVTDDYDLMRERFNSSSSNKKKQIILEGLSRVNSSQAVNKYRRYIDQHLNLGVFEHLWRSRV